MVGGLLPRWVGVLHKLLNQIADVLARATQLALKLGGRSGLTRQSHIRQYYTIFSIILRSVKKSNRGLQASLLGQDLPPPEITPRRLVSETPCFRLPFTDAQRTPLVSAA